MRLRCKRERSGPDCREETALTCEEKMLFSSSLRESGLSENVFGFYEALARLSTEKVRWVFIKAFAENELLGIGIFAKVHGLNASQLLRSDLRARRWLQHVGKFLRPTMYFSVHNLCSSLSTPFLCKDDNRRATVVGLILSWLKQSGHDVIIIDSSSNSDLYTKSGFGAFPFASNSWLDVTRYAAVGDYHALHRATRRKIARFAGKANVAVDTLSGAVAQDVVRGMKECLACSRQNARGLLPFQDFFETRVFETEVLTSAKYVHFVVSVDAIVAGFQSFLSCGKNLGGVMGGIDRAGSGKVPVYQLAVVAALEFAITNKYDKLCFSIVDNYTKLRMMDSFESQSLYHYSRKLLAKRVFGWSYPFSAGYQLHELERDAREKQEKALKDRSRGRRN